MNSSRRPDQTDTEAPLNCLLFPLHLNTRWYGNCLVAFSQDPLGEGSFGKVKKGTIIQTRQPCSNKVGELVAIKNIKLDETLSPAIQDSTLREIYGEIDALDRVDQLVGLSESIIHVDRKNQKKISFAMTYFPGETLANLRKVVSMPIVKLLSGFVDVSRDLARIHHQNLIHRDISENNILINSDTGKGRLIDYGKARIISDRVFNSHALIGTIAVIAPEIRKKQSSSKGKEPTISYTKASDIYALGMCLAQSLFLTVEDASEKIGAHQKAPLRLLRWEEISDEYNLMPREILRKYYDLLSEMTHVLPETRPDAITVMQRLKALNQELTLLAPTANINTNETEIIESKPKLVIISEEKFYRCDAKTLAFLQRSDVEVKIELPISKINDSNCYVERAAALGINLTDFILQTKAASVEGKIESIKSSTGDDKNKQQIVYLNKVLPADRLNLLSKGVALSANGASFSTESYNWLNANLVEFEQKLLGLQTSKKNIGIERQMIALNSISKALTTLHMFHSKGCLTKKTAKQILKAAQIQMVHTNWFKREAAKFFSAFGSSRMKTPEAQKLDRMMVNAGLKSRKR